MNESVKNTLIALLTIFIVLLIDQSLKFWVKTNMYIGESSEMWNWKIKWFRIIFVENEGMAFGIRLPGNSGKLFLTIFRIIIALLLAIYIGLLIFKTKAKTSLIIVLSLIFAGAVGNIIDSTFYGILFSESPPVSAKSFEPPAEFLPDSGGYASLFHGRVVDMLQFPLFNVHLPDWLPFFGGQSFVFFEPVFNIADASIFIGVVILIIFGKKLYKNKNYAEAGNSS